MLRAIKAGLCYFALTFGAGFLLGPLRILLMVPRVGARVAELVELPVMILVTWLAACWTIRRFHRAVLEGTAARSWGSSRSRCCWQPNSRLSCHCGDLTLEQYFATRDPVSGIAYYASLVLLASMPLIVERK